MSALNDILAAVVPVAVTALLGLGSLAVTRLADWLKLSSDDKVRAYLQDALFLAVERSAPLLRGAVGEAAAAAAREAAIATAAGYVRDRVPDALARFGIDDPALSRMIEARLPGGDAAPQG